MDNENVNNDNQENPNIAYENDDEITQMESKRIRGSDLSKKILRKVSLPK